MVDYQGKLLIPGMIDTHIHYPQTDMIAAYGTQLLEWLSKYTFPTEGKFADKGHAEEVANFFLEQLLASGTTTALVMTTTFAASVDAFFEAAAARQLRMIAGKMMMDRCAPDFLTDTPDSSYQDSKALIAKWHGRGRLLYAVTPRFAITSSPEQLALAGQLLREHPGVYLHTHLSENHKEIDTVASQFPEDEDYLAVYDRRGLVTNRSVFAHGIHLSAREKQRLQETGASVAFCPTSNLFLGSGLFDMQQAKCGAHPFKVGLGSDVGGGTAFSLLNVASEGYKVAQMLGQTLSPFKTLFLATLGGAQVLSLQHCLGNFEAGKEADFVVLDAVATPLLARRAQNHYPPRSLADAAHLFFGLQTLAPANAVFATHILGNRLYSSSSSFSSASSSFSSS